MISLPFTRFACLVTLPHLALRARCSIVKSHEHDDNEKSKLQVAIPLAKPTISRGFSTMNANFIFEANVIKGPPGVGFGMVVEKHSKTGYFIVTQVSA